MGHAWARCNWATNQVAALGSLCTRPASTAASSPSEYENPPTGRAGEANHISGNKAPTDKAAGAGSVVVVVSMAMCVTVVMPMLTVAVTVAVVPPMAAPVFTVGAGLGFKGFAHLVHGQVHLAQHVGQHVVGFDFQVVHIKIINI